MTPRRELHVALAGLLIAVSSVAALFLADASGQPKPSVQRTLLGLADVFGLALLVGGLIVHGSFWGSVVGILVGAFVAFWVGAAFGLLVTTSGEELLLALGLLAAIGWLIVGGTLWGNVRKAG